MNYDKFASLVSRVLLLAAFVLLTVGLIESAANVFGYTVIHQSHRPSRLIELAAAVAVMAIALLLRQIRDQLRKRD